MLIFCSCFAAKFSHSQGLLLYLCSKIIPGSDMGIRQMLGIDPGLGTCMASSLLCDSNVNLHKKKIISFYLVIFLPLLSLFVVVLLHNYYQRPQNKSLISQSSYLLPHSAPLAHRLLTFSWDLFSLENICSLVLFSYTL